MILKTANRQNANICLILFFNLKYFPSITHFDPSFRAIAILIQGNCLMVNGYTTRCFPVLTLIISGHELQPIARTEQVT